MHHGIKMVDESKRFKESVLFTGVFLTLLWAVKITENILRLDFGKYGIYPRTIKGIAGIFLAPFIHGDIYHLISNTFPIAILGISILYFYREIAHYVIAGIYLLSGFWVWVAARSAYHIGASGLVYGMMFYLFVAGFINMDKRQLSVSFIIMVLYGGTMFSGLMPVNTGVSWEAHLTGATAGIFFAILFKKRTSIKSEDISVDEKREFENADHTSDEFLNIHIEYKEDFKKKVADKNS